MFASHETKLSITKVFSIIGSSDYQNIMQTINKTNQEEDKNEFHQAKGSAGLSITPFSGLEIRSDFSKKYLSSNSTPRKAGNEEKYELIYNPNKYENFEIQLNISKVINNGFGFNKIQKDQLLQTNNENIALNIIRRNDEVYLGSLNLSMVFPSLISDSLIDKIVVSGEGYLKYINDRLSPENSLMINGFLFSIRLEL